MTSPKYLSPALIDKTIERIPVVQYDDSGKMIPWTMSVIRAGLKARGDLDMIKHKVIDAELRVADFVYGLCMQYDVLRPDANTRDFAAMQKATGLELEKNFRAAVTKWWGPMSQEERAKVIEFSHDQPDNLSLRGLRDAYTQAEYRRGREAALAEMAAARAANADVQDAEPKREREVNRAPRQEKEKEILEPKQTLDWGDHKLAGSTIPPGVKATRVKRALMLLNADRVHDVNTDEALGHLVAWLLANPPKLAACIERMDEEAGDTLRKQLAQVSTPAEVVEVKATTQKATADEMAKQGFLKSALMTRKNALGKVAE